MDPFDGFSERTEIMHELSGTDYSVAISGYFKKSLLTFNAASVFINLKLHIPNDSSEDYWLFPREKNNVLPAKTTWPSSSSINGCSLSYHVGERIASEFNIQNCESNQGPHMSFAMQPPVPVTKQFAIPALLALCGDIESNPGPKRERPPTKEQIMQGKVCKYGESIQD